MTTDVQVAEDVAVPSETFEARLEQARAPLSGPSWPGS